MDVLTKKQRHYAMQRIHSTDTRPEITLRKALWKQGIRYRKNYKKLPGSPDIAITKYKIAVFCDGELFHGKNWNYGEKEHILHGGNGEFWVKKIERNMARDKKNNEDLLRDGCKVLRFWGNDILKNTSRCIDQIFKAIEERGLIKG